MTAPLMGILALFFIGFLLLLLGFKRKKMVMLILSLLLFTGGFALLFLAVRMLTRA
ncbi:hypothetical protein [Metabacillus iocasae]|uniref:Multisubunit Na+/H+ antiporter MnhC subunit n=1 Tax=Priestia iocasae TaxID=2291674 RepID=A0ABS2QYS5_9BACI|nr:hypothetical protein [Metabacillus iocasae]MBM7704585.1 multisubunit Na+/H+ antiporter MnhC subunit [Metabacillus iocasae]